MISGNVSPWLLVRISYGGLFLCDKNLCTRALYLLGRVSRIRRQQDMSTREVTPKAYAVLGLGIGVRNSISRINERIKITSRYWIGSNPYYPNEYNEKTAREGKYVQVVFAAHRFVCKIWNATICGMLSVWLPLRNIWISRLHVATVRIGCLSAQASAKLQWAAWRDLQVNPLQST